jgi:hypothetical protein
MRTLICAFLLPALAACGSAAVIEERAVSPSLHIPVVAERIDLPAGAHAVAAWLAPQGSGFIALSDGRIFAVDVEGHAQRVDRVPGETGETLVVSAFGDRGSGQALGFGSGGAVSFEGGLVRRTRLPTFINSPRAFANLRSDALWATSDDLYARHGDRWLRVEGGAGISELVATGAPGEAWVRTGTSLRRLRIDDPGVTWLDAAPGVDLGAVKGIANVDARRNVVASARGITIVSPDRIRIFHAYSEDGLPEVVGGGGGWAWVGWRGQILRTDGERWESLARGLTFGPHARIAVDDESGANALVIDEGGNAFRVEVEETLRASGVTDGSITFDTRLALEMLTSRSGALKSVSFFVDKHPFSSRKEAPWGWGADGARVADLKEISFGRHTIDVVARDRNNREVTRKLQFEYRSPLGRVPSYEKDIAPLYKARCAGCHANGVARDLSTYGALTGQATLVRAAVREGRMPPDVLLDAASTRLFTAWVDGNTPK